MESDLYLSKALLLWKPLFNFNFSLSSAVPDRSPITQDVDLVLCLSFLLNFSFQISLLRSFLLRHLEVTQEIKFSNLGKSENSLLRSNSLGQKFINFPSTSLPVGSFPRICSGSRFHASFKIVENRASFSKKYIKYNSKTENTLLILVHIPHLWEMQPTCLYLSMVIQAPTFGSYKYCFWFLASFSLSNWLLIGEKRPPRGVFFFFPGGNLIDDTKSSTIVHQIKIRATKSRWPYLLPQ